MTHSFPTLRSSDLLEFVAKTEFTNPAGFVQGGLIAAMLDDTLGPAAYAMANGERMPSTIDLHVHYLRPVRPGRVTTKARVVSTGTRIAFLSGELLDRKSTRLNSSQ